MRQECLFSTHAFELAAARVEDVRGLVHLPQLRDRRVGHATQGAGIERRLRVDVVILVVTGGDIVRADAWRRRGPVWSLLRGDGSSRCENNGQGDDDELDRGSPRDAECGHEVISHCSFGVIMAPSFSNAASSCQAQTKRWLRILDTAVRSALQLSTSLVTKTIAGRRDTETMRKHGTTVSSAAALR